MNPNIAAMAALNVPTTLSVAMERDRGLFVDQMIQFFDNCKKGTNNLRMEDLHFITESVSASRMRASPIPSELAMFPEDAERNSIVDLLYRRVIKEHLEFGRISLDTKQRICSVATWAALQVADMECLRALKKELVKNGIPAFFQNIEKLTMDWSIMFKMFFTHPMSDDQKNQGTIQPGWTRSTLGRNERLAQECLKRDKYRCIVTGDPHPQACHIFPFAGWNHSMKPSIKAALGQLWGGIRADALLRNLQQDKALGVETLGNLLALSPSMHKSWECGDFAFHPTPPKHGNDPLKGPVHWITLTIYWMRKRQVTQSVHMGHAMRSSAASILQGEADEGYPPTHAVDLYKSTPIIDGDRFTVYASTEAELPSFEILMLQWDIIRMASLCGGAEPEDDEEKDEDSDTGEAVGAIEEDS